MRWWVYRFAQSKCPHARNTVHDDNRERHLTHIQMGCTELSITLKITGSLSSKQKEKITPQTNWLVPMRLRKMHQCIRETHDAEDRFTTFHGTHKTKKKLRKTQTALESLCTTLNWGHWVDVTRTLETRNHIRHASHMTHYAQKGKTRKTDHVNTFSWPQCL